MYPAVMSPTNSRKRAAPGASPVLPFTQMQQPFSATQGDPMVRWNSGGGGATDANNFADAGPRAMSPYNSVPVTQGQFTQTSGAQAAPSTALARRGINQALVPAGPRQNNFDASSSLWDGFADGVNFPGTPGGPVEDNDSIEHLEELAQRAKRDAQAKRKQIPPFVQKLSSFLDESRNTELIRWSDKGDSFIVLDEDEFAKTLIPELFKHNNYASFVRQLNMYGFHKRVGLSDNSMKASERKNKSPSEYYNPYFRRGHPTLLWLINKPKSGNSKKKGKKEEGEPDSDEEPMPEETFPGPSYVATQVSGRVAPHNNNEVVPLQRRDLVQIKTQLEKLQQQQTAISDILQKLRRDHYALSQQALQFQSQHNRHEQSINAILTFLANVFRKSLEEQGGAQSVQELLANLMPGSQGPSPTQVPQGSVVDLSDFFTQAASGVAMGTAKRPQRLLPPIPQTGGKVNTASPSPAPPSVAAPESISSVTELFDTSPTDTTSPAFIHSELQNNPQEGMMKIIQDTNAGKTGINLPKPSKIPKPQPTSSSSSNPRSNNVLNNMMTSQTTTPSVVPSATAPTTAPAPITASPPPSVSAPIPPLSPTTIASLANSGTSLSPIMSSMPLPSLQNLAMTQSEIDALQRLQEEQASQIDEISHVLGPLSPSGRIPGLDSDSGPFDNVDIDQFINQNAFSDFNYDPANFGAGAMPGSTDGADFNFGFDGSNEFVHGSGGGAPVTSGASGFTPGRVFETNSPTDTSSPVKTDETGNNELEHPERDLKRRRRD